MARLILINVRTTRVEHVWDQHVHIVERMCVCVCVCVYVCVCMCVCLSRLVWFCA